VYRPWQTAHLTTQPVLIEKLSKLRFKVGDSGRLELPSDFDSSVKIGNKKYTIGMGGLHSVDDCKTVYSNHDRIIKEIDVDSFYPSIMLNCGYLPGNFDRSEFYAALKKIASSRYVMKISGDEAASALKIVLNGIFGRLGYEHSDMQDVEALLHVTITGQIQLLMLIEALTAVGCEIITANTDGIVVSMNADVDARSVAIVNRWCKLTGHGVKTSKLKMIHVKSMNNYVAVDDSGEVKRKGAFATKGSALNSELTKNRSGDVISNSATDAILSGRSVHIDTSKVDKNDFVFCGIDDGYVKRWYFDKSGLKYISKLSEVDTSSIDVDYYVKKAEKLISRKLEKIF
jgi:DNA polymerase elongation subunit (family B)